jgi:RNA polymerase sigma-70 factor (ECF subfamily)
MRDEETDGTLVRRIGARATGSMIAERRLCARFAPRIRLYGLRHLRDDDRARDLVQTVLIAVIEAARNGRIEDPDRTDRFVLGVCRNTVLRVREVEGRTRPVEDADLASLVADAPLEPLAHLAALLRCLQALDERAQEVVSLSFQADLPPDEIAQRMSTSPGNVRVLRHRAIAALRKCLDDKEARR